MEPVERLRRIRGAAAGPGRAKALEELEGLVKSGEVRDFPFGVELYEELFALLADAFGWRAKEAQSDVWCAERIFLGFTRSPEFDHQAAEPFVVEHWLRALASRTDGTALQEEWPMLRDLYLWAYGRYPAKRATVRVLIGRTLRSSAHFMHKSAPVVPLLEVLAPVIRGFKPPLSPVHRSLLQDVLLPLHRSSEWLQWDRQTPLIGMFHKELVQCILLFLEKQPALAPKCVEVVCSYFPQSREANTPKEVLLVYEVSQVLKYVDEPGFQQILPLMQRHMSRLLSSHNSQPIQSLLQYWKDDHIAKLFSAHSASLIPAILPSLLRGGEPFWNPTVNRMTSLVLEKLEASNPEVFRRTAEELWGPGKQTPLYLRARAERAAAEAAARAEQEASPTDAGKAPGKPQDVSSLKFCLGGWKPPSSGGGGGSGGKPPLTATGVAPWAMSGGGGAMGSAGGKQPPLTATGVAPWAFKGGSAMKPGPLSGLQAGSGAPGAVPGGRGPAPLPGGAGAGQPERGSIGGLRPCRESEEEEEEGEKSGLDRVHDYLKVLCPEGLGDSGEAAQPWEAALTAETPTLLPTLKFHQLVFGAEDLASGAFSVVRYARTIIKDKTRSQWPEYAVKVINTTTIQEHGYEASVNREICVLKMLSHPGIARMVSAFRWRDGAYLVLEYAARGDLHTILVQQGKLPEETVRFFLGETIAALVAIHEVGFVYGDLKPENIVITATCHAKLTDFGGCRPITEEARARTRQSLLRRLRDGDWRARDAPAEEAEAPVGEEEAAAAADDGRVEGTTLYLPPEVVRGGAPTMAADAWALGCLQYQLLTGKPPIWADSEREEDLRSRIVTFRLDDGRALEPLPDAARALIGRLLEADVARRLPVADAAKDAFFEGTDVFTLYTRPRGPEVAAAQRSSGAASGGDARWQKRQFSKIWTVMPSPQDYELPRAPSGAGGAAASAPPWSFDETGVESGAPFCEEVDSPMGAPRIESL